MTGERVALVAGTRAGRGQAHRLARAWPRAELVEAGSVAESLRTAWRGAFGVVAFVPTGVVVRVLGPLLADKRTDPAVVVVDDAGRHAIALLGGHAGGANELAERVAAVLAAEPVVSTATDARGLPGLDGLGWPVEGALAAVTRAVLDGEPVHLDVDATWPLPPLPPNVTTAPDPAQPVRYRIAVTDRLIPPDERTVVLRPPSLVVGVGASRGVPAAELDSLIAAVLSGAGLSPASVRALATADLKADEPGVLQVARRHGWPVETFPVAALDAVPVPTPSDVVRAAVGTGSVAEAAALLACPGAVLPDGTRPVPAGPAQLLVPKTPSSPKGTAAMATVAVARHAPRGQLSLVGLGPGARDLLTPSAVSRLRASSVVVGLDQYLDQVRDLLRPGTRILASGLGQEQQRARSAVEQARAGHAVALIGSGDCGVYAMASPALEEAGADLDVHAVPGVTAALAAAGLLGAPLGHDHAAISLSDLHTPWPVIEQRVRAAAEGDFVVVFYNPRSRDRHWQLAHALRQLSAHRPAETPVAVVRNASRPDQSVRLSTLAKVDPGEVDMLSIVVVGSSQTRIVAGRMVTPRGYRWRAEQANPAPARSSTRLPPPIEAQSYRILRSTVDTSHLPPLTRAVTERVIHASADLEYATDLVCTEPDLRAGLEALRTGAPVVTDVRMVAAGITRRDLTGEVICRVADPAVAALAARAGITRSAAAVRLACEQAGPGAVWVIGCAPTALFELLEQDAAPALVIGLPVGFVGAAESKAALRASGWPQLSNVTAKGGSAVAAAAVNALLYLDREDLG